MKRQGAFTLIELLTVIVIIGIIIGMAVPVMTSLTRSTGLQGGLRQISNLASLARQFAITHRVQTELRVTNTYNAVAVFTNGPGGSVQIDKWDALPIGVIVDPVSPLSIKFKSTGGTVGGGNGTIVVREGVYDIASSQAVSTNGNLGTINIDGMIGRITVTRP
jgi:prepilin-type N-terminal cleavage/methylation domain-containing protein